ncbi:MAG: hypothetical protein WC438_00325 [Candidatus Pacearchaeota archaeon]
MFRKLILSIRNLYSFLKEVDNLCQNVIEKREYIKPKRFYSMTRRGKLAELDYNIEVPDGGFVHRGKYDGKNYFTFTENRVIGLESRCENR